VCFTKYRNVTAGNSTFTNCTHMQAHVHGETHISDRKTQNEHPDPAVNISASYLGSFGFKSWHEHCLSRGFSRLSQSL